ncbi:MAG: glycosyltransferase [Ignavibacteriae bacterium]|nr:glycosyltransferase [Ignavibacteriota bacterium]NOH00040.1 glycosyltransferase [Ignavibacteriota bacterium]
MDNSKLKIAVFVANLYGGGAERMMLNLAKGFAEKGIETQLVLAIAEGPYLKDIPSSIEVIDFESKKVLYSINKLRKYLVEQKPDVLISTLSRVNIAAIIAKSLAGVNTKLILREANTFSVYLDSNKSIWDKIIDSMIKILYRRGDKIVAVSEGVADDLKKTLPRLKSKITVIYNPVIDEEVFERADEPVDNDWFNDEEIPVIIGVGRISEQKDFSTLIKAFNIVSQQKEIRLLILGKYNENDQEYVKLIELINELGISDKVKFEGFVSNPFAYLSRASVFVLSSKWEGLPGVLIQALACGCPVVSTDCPSGPNEVINNESIGYLSPVGDYEILADKIIKTLDRNIDKTILINRAKEFSVDKGAENYLKMIAAL